MQKANEIYTAAVIGLGFIGAGDQVSGDALGQQVANLDGTHAQALAGHARVRLVAGSSRDKGRRQRFTERLGVTNTYADWREMLAAESPDIVSVATYSPFHAEITIACAETGALAVLCEKPIATKLSDADRMITACRKHGTSLVVNHNRRWHPLWRSVRDEIRQGRIGRVEQMSLRWASGRLGNVGTHMFDAAAFVLGSVPVAVSGTLDPEVPPDCRGPQFHDPGGWGIVRFGNGVPVFVHAPHDLKSPFELRIVCERGCIEVTRDHAAVKPRDGDARFLATPPDHPSSLTVAVDETVRCLDDETASSSTGEDGRNALEVIVGFHVSDRCRGRWVPLPLSGGDRDLDVKIG